MSNAWFSEIDLDGAGEVHIEEMQLDSGVTSIRGVSMKGSAHNCWIFCVSMSDNFAGKVSDAHESKWKIPGENINEFCNHIGTLLWESISFEDIPPDFSKKYSLQELNTGLGLKVEMRPVDYTVREALIQKESDFPVEKIRDLKERIAFIKPSTFSAEREFRFAYWLTFRNQKISINDNPKVIQLRKVDSLVETARDK